MTAADCLSGPGPLRLALTLVHFLWQGLAVAALTALAVRAMALRAGPPRYAAYLTALLALAACPVVTFLLVEPPVAPHTLPAEAAGLSDTADGLPASSASGPWQAVGGADVPAGQPSAPTGGPYTHAPIAPPLAAAARAVSPPPAAPPATEDSVGARLLHAVSPALPWITAAWIAGVCALSLRLCAGAIGTLRWRRQLVESPPALRPMLAELAQRMGLPGFARVFLSPRAPQPIVVGYLRPLILLPATMLSGMPEEMLRAVLAHELAHIRRLDLWVNLLQRLTETMLFYHPAVWWVSGRLRSQRELCCDELAVSATGEPLAYAATLERAYAAGLTRAGAAVGLGAGRMPTLARIKHILGLSPSPARSRWWLAGAAALLVLLSLAIALPLACRTGQPVGPQAPAAETEVSGIWPAEIKEEWLTGLWMYRRKDNPGPGEANIYMTLLNPDKSWASLSVWGEPEKPSRVLVRERGLEWELRGNGTAKPFVFKVVSRGPGGSVTSFSIPVTNVTGTMLTSSSWCDNLMLTTEHERGGPAVLEAIGKALTGSGVAVGKMPAAQPVDWPGKPDAKQMQGAWVRHQGGNNEYVFLTIRPDGTWARGRFYGSPENPVRIGVDQEGPDWKPQQGLFKEWGAHFTVTKRPDGGDSSWGGPVDRLTTDAMVLNGAYQRAGSLLAARLALAEPIPLTPTTNPSHAVTAKRLAQPGWVVNLTGVTLAEALGQFEARLGGRIRVDWADLWLAGVAPGCEVNYHPPVEATLEQALQGMFRSLEEATFCRVEKDGVVHVGLDAELWSKSQEKRSDRAGYAKGQELLAKRWPKIEIVDKELGWAIDMIREQQAIEIHVKWRALEAIGITARTKVSFTLPAGEAKEALAALVAGISPKVIYEIDDGIIIISAAGDPALLPRLVQKTYDIRDLLMAVPDFKGPSLNPAPPVADGPAMGWHFEASSTAPRPATVPAGPSEQEMADRIFEAIKKNIAPDSWNRPGVMLGRLHGKLILTQTAAVHNEVEKLLRRMEFEIGKQTLIEARFITVPVSESGFHEFLTTTARAVFAPGADGSQAATITPIQDDLILQMAQGRRGILVRTAPRIMLLNGQRSYVITGIHGAALLPGLEGAKEAPAFFGSGLALDIRTAVSDDLRQVTLTARPMMTSMPDVANSKDAQYAEGSVTARVDFGQTLLVQVPVQHREAIGVRQVKDARTGITQPQVVEKPLPAQMTLYVMIKPRLAMGFAREPAFPPSATQPAGGLNLTGVTLAEALGQFEARLGGRIRVDWADLWLADLTPDSKVNYQPPAEATLEQALQGMCRSLEEAAFCRVEKDGVVRVGLDVELWHRSYDRRFNPAGYARSQELLAKRWPKIEIVDQELGQALKTLKSQGLAVQVWWRDLERIGITPKTKVTLALPAGTTKEVMDAFVAGISPKAAYKFDTGVEGITVSTVEGLNPSIVQRTYDVRDLLIPVRSFEPPDDAIGTGWRPARGAASRPATPMAEPSEQEMDDRLLETVRKNVAPGSWQGDKVQLGRMHGKLIVTQTPDVHKEVEKLLQRMRFDKAKTAQVETKFITLPAGDKGVVEYLARQGHAGLTGGADGVPQATITATQADAIAALAKANAGGGVLATPRVLLRNGGRAWISMGSEQAATLPGLEGAGDTVMYYPVGILTDLAATVSDDLRSVTVTARPFTAALKDDKKPLQTEQSRANVTARLDKGQVLLLQIPIERRQVLGVRLIKDAATGNTQPHVVEKPLPSQEVLYALVSAEIALHKDERAEFPPPPSFASTRPAGGLSIEYKAWLKTISLRDGTLTYRWATLKPDQRPSKNLAAYDSHTFSRALTAEELRLMGRWVQIYRIFALPTRLEQPFPAATDNPSRLLVTQGDDRYEVDLTARLIPDNLALAIASLDAFCRRISDAEDLISSMGDRAVMTVNEAQMLSLQVVSDVPPALAAERDAALAKAQADLAVGIVKLAERFPVLKKGRDFDRLTAAPLPGRISVWLMHIDKGKAKSHDHVPDGERFQVCVSVGPPPEVATATMPSPLYRRLGLVGETGLQADNGQLQSALKLLVADALAPLDALEAKAAQSPTVPPATKSGAATEAPEAVKALEGQIASLSERWAKVQSRWGATPPAGRAELQKQLDEIAAQAAQVDEKISQAWETMVGRPITVEGDAVRDKDGTHLLPSPGQFPYRIPLGEAPPNLRGGQRVAVRATGVLQLDKHTVTQAEVDQYKRDVLDTKNPKQMQYGRDRVGDVIREFYLKDLEVTVLSAATQPAGEWGAADAGVRIRLRALTEAIEAGLFPRLAIDIRNQAAGTLAVASEFLELEVDGQWYGHQQFDSLFIGPVDLPAGQGQDGYLIPPWGQWWAKDRPNSGLVFLPGRHTIRTALIGRVGAPGAAVRAVSNAVSVDVLTAAAAATRPGVERNQASKPLVMTGESWLRQEQTYHVITVAGRVSSSAATRPAPSTPPRPVGERPEPPSGAGGQGAASRAVP